MKPRKDILRRQKRMQAAKKTNVKFRNLGSHGDRVLDSVQWKTLTRIYQFGLSVGLSRSQGDELLKMMQLVLDENGSHIQLRKTWRSLKVSIGKQKVKGSYSIGRFKYELPKDYFGTKHWRSQRPLRCFNASAIDIRCVLADILMSVNNQEQCKFTFVTPKDEHGVAVPRDEQILEGFCTGDRFKAISEYYDQLPPIRGLHIVPILLKISLDDTTLSASRVTSECPVYISVMNIEGQEQPLHHLGFAPRHLPYSEDDMRKQLAQQGITTNKHQVRENIEFLMSVISL